MEQRVVTDTARVPAAPRVGRFVAQFFEGRNQRTLDAYRRDLEDFQVFIEADTLEAACWQLVGHGPGPANSLVLDYRNQLSDLGRSPATVNRRLAALRAIVKQAALVGLPDAQGQPIGWRLEVKGLKSQAYRDTRGPGTDAFQALLAHAAGQRNQAKAARDVALLRLLHDRGLRRGELVVLDLEDLDLDQKRVAVLGKGRTEKEWLTLAGKTCESLVDWLVHRDSDVVPLFHNFDHNRQRIGADGQARRLTGRSVARLVEGLAKDADLGDISPHGLRHLAITTALDRTKGDVRSVQRFSRHKDIKTLMAYDDNRADIGGEITELVAD